MAVVLISAWWAVSHFVLKKLYAEASTRGARTFLEKQLLALDEIKEQPVPATAWGRLWLHMLASRQAVGDLYEQLKERRRTATGLSIEYALACRSFADCDSEVRWREREQAALKSAGCIPANWSFYSAAAKALNGDLPTDQDLQCFDEARQSWPGDWWVARTAMLLGKHGQIDSRFVKNRQHMAMRDLSMAAVIDVLGIVLGIGSLMVVWRMRRRYTRLQVRYSDHRIWRLWNPPALISVLAVGSAAAALIQIWSNRQMLNLLAAASSGVGIESPVVLGRIAAGLALVVTVFLAVLLTIAFRLVFPPRKRSVWPALGFCARDLIKPKFWLLGVACGGLLVPLVTLIRTGWSRMQLGGDEFDATSTEFFVAFGSMAFPVAIAYASVVAPLFEETIFRGYIFTALREQYGAVIGVTGSSAVFALSHSYSPAGTVCVFLFGAIFAWLYHKTGRLAASMITHSCVNLLITPANLLLILP